MRYEGQIHPLPQHIPRDELLVLIEKYLTEGKNFHEIGRLFGVSETGIQYHWKRYKLGLYKKPRQPHFHFTKKMRKRITGFADRWLNGHATDDDISIAKFIAKRNS